MAHLSVMIESSQRMSVQNGQLLIRGAEERSVPIEDISCLLIDNLRCAMTTAAINALAANGTAVLVCGRNHLPSALLTPFSVHSRGFYRLKSQLAVSVPAKKRLWQRIVKNKITNQAACLHQCGEQMVAQELVHLSRCVLSGDSGNLEAEAARKYFPVLFGTGFIRGKCGRINAALNYGYAIVRGSLARHLANAGYYPAIGIFHHSGANNFNLADDLIEPFRPVVDALVAHYIPSEGELSVEDRHKLMHVLQTPVYVNERTVTLDFALSEAVRALETAFDGNGAAFPQISLSFQDL